MKFEIVIFKGSDFVGDPIEAYQIENLKPIIKRKWQQDPKVVFNSDFEEDDKIYLVFGDMSQGVEAAIKRVENNVFFFSAPFGSFGYLLKKYELIGFCDGFSYHSGGPIFYGRKSLVVNMKDANFGLMNISHPDFYISYHAIKNIGILDFIFDYLEVYLSNVVEQRD